MLKMAIITLIMGPLSYYAGRMIKKNKKRAIIVLVLAVLIYGIYICIL